eukprot:TRINITY_DN1129_c0_g1_i2.p1 TRINITY_DN1129_c0_g1~~TRINITY_DN1129_c0_g1_i2.p1  ORF type:complete len:1207 (+),score=417.91 TRINITY_DN1129_c0_g1_i2:110-3622(+)
MGAGTSSAHVQSQVPKWEGLVTELEGLCVQQRSALDQGFGGGRFAPSQGSRSPTRAPPLQRSQSDADSAGKRRRSSILKQESEVRRIEERRKSASASAAGSDAGDGRNLSRRNSSISFTGGRPPEEIQAAVEKAAAANAKSTLSPKPGRFAADVDTASAAENMVEVDGVLKTATDAKRQNRQELLKARKVRKEFFQEFMEEKVDESSQIACTYLGQVCAALSYLLACRADGYLPKKNRVTVEDIFFTCHLPLHYIQNPAITLAELYDISKEFIDHDPRFRDQVRVEVFHMDPILVDGEVEQGEFANDTGDRGPPSVAVFRKMVEDDMKGLAAVSVFNFDPFVVEQSKLHVDDSEESDEDAEEIPMKQPTADPSATPTGEGAARGNECMAVYSSKNAPKTQFGRANMGWFSLCYDFNSVQHTIMLADAHIDSEVHLTTNEAPLMAMYKACCSRDNFNKRCRGFIRFSLAEVAPPLREEEVLDSRELFVPDLYLGKGHHGIPLSSVDPIISPHIVAYAMAVHLIQGMVLDESGVGINVMSVCKEMVFPLQCVCNFPMTLIQSFAYFQEYLAKTKLSEKMYAIANPIETKVDTDDAPPTMSIMDFENVLIQTMERSMDSTMPSVVMILCFEVGCAHNTLRLAPEHASHYGFLMSYDQDKQMASVLDVNPKKFTRIWVTSLTRLHKALIGRGYIMLYKREEEEEGGEVYMPRQDTMIKKQLSNLTLPPQARLHIRAFEFPPVAMCVTALAVALNRLGEQMRVSHLVYQLDCDISFLTSDHISVQDMGRIMNNYLNHSGKKAEYSCQVVNCDKKADGSDRVTLEEFSAMLKTVDGDSNTDVILQCSLPVLRQYGGGNGGEYLCLVEIRWNEDGSGMAFLADVNPQIYFRHIQMPVARLFQGMCEVDVVSHRAGGYLLVSKGKPMPDYCRYDKGRACNSLLCPSTHPFRLPQAVHLSAISFALTHLGHPCSPEEIFYNAFTCLAGERYRRGSAIFPWQQLKISLHQLKERMTVSAVARMLTKFEQSMHQDMKGDNVSSMEKDQFRKLLADSTKRQAQSLLIAVYSVQNVHNIESTDPQWRIGCGLVKGYDADTSMVTVADCNPTRYGDFWQCSVDTLYEATDLHDPEKDDNGLIRIVKASAASLTVGGSDEPRKGGDSSPKSGSPAGEMTFQTTGF